MIRRLAVIYATDVEYSGNFVDNDEVDLFYLGSGKDKSSAEVELIETHIIKKSEVNYYENKKEIIDLGNGKCTVYWCEIEEVEEDNA